MMTKLRQAVLKICLRVIPPTGNTVIAVEGFDNSLLLTKVTFALVPRDNSRERKTGYHTTYLVPDMHREVL